MSSPYPNLSPEGQRLFDPGQMTDEELLNSIGLKVSRPVPTDPDGKDAEIEYLRKELVQWNDLKVALGAKDSTAFFDALANRDNEIERLRKLVTEHSGFVVEAIAIFDRYLNVPESVALRKRWESFKNQTL